VVITRSDSESQIYADNSKLLKQNAAKALLVVCAIFVKKRCNLHSVLDANLHVRKCAIFVKKKYITNRQT